MKKLVLAIVFVSFASAMLVSAQVMAASSKPAAPANLSAQYAEWAGSKANADSLVNGLRNGESITLVTVSENNKRTLAGFTAQTRMSPEEVAAALRESKRTLASLGIRKPSADQIQVALIGGELTLPNGSTKLISGPVSLRFEPEVIGTVAPAPVQTATVTPVGSPSALR